MRHPTIIHVLQASLNNLCKLKVQKSDVLWCRAACNKFHEYQSFCRIWGSYSGGSEEFCLLEYNAMHSAESQTTACYLFHASFLLCLFFGPEDGYMYEYLRNGWLSTEYTRYVSENRILHPSFCSQLLERTEIYVLVSMLIRLCMNASKVCM
jgi:hypothetical protein